ncbi:uncharacterized protein N7498_008899 [Penicillium cinerascens]|uniref:Alpha/beta hydrolase fold-3 domain-containing protein n=1 Tax=Penicillium cinerascens TaxID=70096 RepID=A0A9W9MA41_9EURO|nr:uncharacterized protein N7498_008899 [Penicillium cinerascens]KAJ5195461.1 hypothetical protein N7498_008899 [Penicillium cinerascens]
MPLSYDPEFLKEAAPVLQQLAQAERAPLHDVATRRSMMAALTRPLPAMPDGVENLVHRVPTTNGHEVAVYHFRPMQEPRDGGEPAIVHIHGGGYFSLSAEQCSVPHVGSVQRTGVQILTIDYRLSPEHPYPTPLNDCWTALEWVYANAERLSIDHSRIALMGESAGGGLAAALTLRARDRALSPPIAKQILVYPMLDDRTTTNHAGELAFWNEVDNITGWTAYLGSDAGSDWIDAYAAPARVESVEGLPPLYIDCPQLDIFVHESLEYAKRFVEANIPTECHVYPGCPHGFEAFAPLSKVVQQAIANRDKAAMNF